MKPVAGSATTMIGASVTSGVRAILQPSRGPCRSVCASSNASRGPGAEAAGEAKKNPSCQSRYHYPNVEMTIVNQKHPQPEDELVDLLVNRVKQYAKIVSALKG